jgi:hypothetical protein
VAPTAAMVAHTWQPTKRNGTLAAGTYSGFIAGWFTPRIPQDVVAQQDSLLLVLLLRLVCVRIKEPRCDLVGAVDCLPSTQYALDQANVYQ